PHFEVDDERHPARLFVLVVGDTSHSGQRTSWRREKKGPESADPSWASKRILGSLSSGEGLIKYMKHLKGENPSAKDLLVNYANEVKRSPDDLETVRFLVEAMNSVVDDEGHVQHGSLNGRGMVVQEEFARTLK